MKGQSKQDNQNVGYRLYPEMVLPSGHVPVYLFGEGGNGAINPIPTKNPGHHYDYKAKARSNLFEFCQYLSVSTFKKCKGRRTQTIDNVDRTCANFLDLDGPISSKWEIMQRCKDLELEDPTFIIKTSQGRFHVLWYLRVPVNGDNLKEVRMWERQQTMLHYAFADLGSDVAVIHDRTRFLRNPYAVGLLNRKYCDERGVSKEMVETVFFTGKPINSMLNNYNALCEAGYRKFLKLRDRSCDVDMQIRAFKIMSFFKSHSMVEATQAELAEYTGIPLGTIKFLLKWMTDRGTLETKVVGRWSERHSAYRLVTERATKIFKVYRKEHNVLFDLSLSKDYTPPDRATVDRPPSAWVLDAFNRTKFRVGCRNMAVYCAAVALQVVTRGRITLEEALERLSGGIGLNISADFGIEEIKKTVKSGLNSVRGFAFRPGTLNWLGFNVGVS